MMRHLLLVGIDPDYERHLASVLDGICTVSRTGRDPEMLRRAAAEGASLIAIDGDMLHGLGADVTGTIADVGRVLPGQPILVLGDESHAAGVLRAIRAGARDVIGRAETAVALRVQLANHFLPATASGNGGNQLHLVLNSLPGVGSPYAINLAVLRARPRKDGLLIDCTLPVSQAAVALDMRLNYTVADAIQDSSRMDRLLLQSALAQHPASGLRVLPLAAAASDAVDRLSPEDILALVHQLRGLFAECVVDAGGIRHPAMLRALAEHATTIHLVAPQTITALNGARALLDNIGPAQDVLDRIVLAIDDHDPAILLDPDQMTATLGLRRSAVIPSVRVAMANALNAGEPLVLGQPSSNYAAAMNAAAGLAAQEDGNPSLVERLTRLKALW